MNYGQSSTNVGQEITGNEHDLTNVELNIGKVELDGWGSRHDFSDIGLDFNDFEQIDDVFYLNK